jgi:dTDP-4-amino-4,6-dideoxygalactose transaminase
LTVPASTRIAPNDNIPVLRPQLPSADRLLPYLRQIDAARYYSNGGRLVQQLEGRLAAQLRQPQGSVVAAASGTEALIGAILASAGRATPERPLAVMPAYTFVATAVAAEHCGYQPYLADVDAETWLLDAERLLRHPERDRIGMVMPVAPFGRPVPQAPWNRFSQETMIPVVIDGAASFEGVGNDPGQYLGATPVALSFHATKSFATAEGGAVVSTDLAFCQRTGQALNFGFWGTRDSATPSTNGKMSEYHAAIGLAELDGWAGKQAAFRRVAETYDRLANGMKLARRFVLAPDIAGCYVLFRCASPAEARKVQDTLEEERIDYRLWYGLGMHRQSYFATLLRGDLGTTDRIAPLVLGLPVAPDLSGAAIARVMAALARAVATD